MTLKHLKYTIALSDNELEQILQLQQRNLVTSISISEKEQEGFVTVQQGSSGLSILIRAFHFGH